MVTYQLNHIGGEGRKKERKEGGRADQIHNSAWMASIVLDHNQTPCILLQNDLISVSLVDENFSFWVPLYDQISNRPHQDDGGAVPA